MHFPIILPFSWGLSMCQAPGDALCVSPLKPHLRWVGNHSRNLKTWKDNASPIRNGKAYLSDGIDFRGHRIVRFGEIWCGYLLFDKLRTMSCFQPLNGNAGSYILCTALLGLILFNHGGDHCHCASNVPSPALDALEPVLSVIPTVTHCFVKK